MYFQNILTLLIWERGLVLHPKNVKIKIIKKRKTNKRCHFILLHLFYVTPKVSKARFPNIYGSVRPHNNNNLQPFKTQKQHQTEIKTFEISSEHQGPS